MTITMSFPALRKPIYNAKKALLLALTLCYLTLGVTEAKLRVGFYSQTCPNAESIVSSVIKKAARTNSRIPAILLRLHFHDCFVEGCDGSILIDNGGDIEKHANAHQGVEGFEEIDKAKQELENVCPGIVSCADIVALGARDAVVLSRGKFYKVETGRRDGRVSSALLADGFPEVNDSIELLKSKFVKKGLSDKDLVLLSGAHTIGTTACFFMGTRLYNFSGRDQQSDPAINPAFLPQLKSQCPNGKDINARIPLDWVSPDEFDDQILRNIKGGFATIASDARLYDNNTTTKQVIDSYVGDSSPSSSSSSSSPVPTNTNSSFEQDFATSMVKMGRIGVRTGSQGEIRTICRAFNS